MFARVVRLGMPFFNGTIGRGGLGRRRSHVDTIFVLRNVVVVHHQIPNNPPLLLRWNVAGPPLLSRGGGGHKAPGRVNDS